MFVLAKRPSCSHDYEIKDMHAWQPTFHTTNGLDDEETRTIDLVCSSCGQKRTYTQSSKISDSLGMRQQIKDFENRFSAQKSEPKERKTMRARFLGVDSLGYQYGQEYDLVSYIHNGYLWVKDLSGKAKDCPYSGIEAFFNNWHLLSREMTISNDESWDDF